MALLQVITSQKVVRGTGRRRTRVRKVVVLYQIGLHGMADGRGRFTGYVRITYTPARPAQAGLVVLSRARAGAASTNVRVTIVNGGL